MGLANAFLHTGGTKTSRRSLPTMPSWTLTAVRPPTQPQRAATAAASPLALPPLRALHQASASSLALVFLTSPPLHLRRAPAHWRLWRLVKQNVRLSTFTC